jgi:hypothetical protein
MVSIRILLRLASKLTTLRRQRRNPQAWNEQAAWDRLDEQQQALAHCRRRLDLARARDFTLAASVLHEEFIARLQTVRETADHARAQSERPARSGHDLTDWLAELRQIEAEFGEVQIDWQEGILTVTTTPITLRDVYLGPFAIQLHWNRLAERMGSHCFSIEALDPQPAATDPDVPHPHAKNGKLCAGDAAGPIAQALEQGRLADAFCLVRAVLSHYNPDSPHVPLENWEGTECYNCGSLVAEEERCTCESCDHDYCDDCMAYCCGCDTSRCRGCLESCADCDAYCCSSCLKPSPDSGRECCPRCLARCNAEGSCTESGERDENACPCPP